MKRGGPIKRKSRLSPVGNKRKREMVEYRRKRSAFLALHPYCQVWLKEHGMEEGEAIAKVGLVVLGGGKVVAVPRSSDVHHVEGRTGGKYLDESTWLAVSRSYHDLIHHVKPSWARERGYLK